MLAKSVDFFIERFQGWSAALLPLHRAPSPSKFSLLSAYVYILAHWNWQTWTLQYILLQFKFHYTMEILKYTRCPQIPDYTRTETDRMTAKLHLYVSLWWRRDRRTESGQLKLKTGSASLINEHVQLFSHRDIWEFCPFNYCNTARDLTLIILLHTKLLHDAR